MPPYSRDTIKKFLRKADRAKTDDAKGEALEDLVEHLFAPVPGIALVRRNLMSVFRSEELDMVLHNVWHPQGLTSLNLFIPVECKSCLHPISGRDLDWFISKIRRRTLDMGILVASHGITGDAAELTAAHDIAASALKDGIRLVVITRRDIEKLTSTEELVTLIQTRLCDLVIYFYCIGPRLRHKQFDRMCL